MEQKEWLQRFLNWKNKHIPHRYFVFLLSILVGFGSGLVAVVLKNSVHLIQSLLTMGFTRDYHNYLYFAYPLIGILITVTVIRKFLLNRYPGHGVPNTLYAISKRNSIVRRISIINSLITSAITVGFGGSTGLEGPSVGASSALGSNIGRYFRMNYTTRTLLIGCASAGALASIFKAPIAAIVFAIEVIMLDLTMTSLIPLLLASVSATLTSRLFFGEDILFHFPLRDAFEVKNVPFYILLGLISGLISIYFSRVYFFIFKTFKKIKKAYIKATIGGVLLGLLIFMFPPLYGEGYETMNAIIDGNYLKILDNSPFYPLRDNFFLVMIIIAAIMLLKVVATTLTLGSGGVGGIFAPSLFMGCLMGFVFAKTINYFDIQHLPESNFTLVGMAGLMAGILHAPLTAIFMIAEITGGYELFIPLMITASISFITVKYALPYSVYTMQLAQRGELITHHKDQAVLTLMRLKNEIETDFEVIHPEMKLGELVKTVAQSHRNLYPVVNSENKFIGLVQLNDIRKIMFNRELYEEVRVEELMIESPALITEKESMISVMKKFEDNYAWNLPVVDESRRYIGFVSKSNLFSAYRNLLKEFYQE